MLKELTWPQMDIQKKKRVYAAAPGKSIEDIA